MEMTLSMGAFEALDQQELFAVDGGTDDWTLGQFVAFVGASAEISVGFTLFICGLGTGNVVVAAAGVGLVAYGIQTGRQYVAN